jgi:uncharacterized phage protein gp47/JayE
MSYSPPSLGPAGLTVPQYNDILADLIAQYQTAYGQNAYLGVDTADYQWISAVSAKCADTMSCCQLAYNGRSPGTAIGAALDNIAKVNGIARKAPIASTAVVTLVGTPNAVINNGVIQDANSYLWNLPAQVTIASGGTISVTATCQTLGAIPANANTITVIATPTSGWTSVTNPAPAVNGEPVELDSQFRARQALSVALPSLTMRATVTAAIAATAGVTRYNILENYFGFTASFGTCNTSGTALTIVSGYPLDATDVGQAIEIGATSYTIATVTSGTAGTLTTSAGTQTGASFYIGDGINLGPQHSLTCVVEGGTNAAVAQTIYGARGIGCYTNGTTSVTVTDPYTAVTMPIRFSLPSYVQPYVSLSIHSLANYTTSTTTAIQTAIVNYLNSLQIGETIVLSELYGAALTVRPNPDAPMFSIRALTLGTTASPTGTSDLAMTYNQVSQGVSANVVITLV